MRRLLPRLAVAIFVLAVSAHDTGEAAEPARGAVKGGGRSVSGAAIRHQPVEYAAIAGWRDDDARAALAAFKLSCTRLGSSPPPALAAVCRKAAALDFAATTVDAARAFFEANFEPHRVVHQLDRGLLTGYYEPVMSGSRTASSVTPVPVYRRPPELVNLVDESRRGTVGAGLTHAASTPSGPKPFATRAEIEQGALKGRGLELMYFADPVDVFFLHIQGSGRVRLPDGRLVRITYDGKNGHPYTSIGRHLIQTGDVSAANMSLASLGDWLRADSARGRRLMWTNASFVFFRELTGPEAEAPHGVNGIPLTEGRSLAVDTSVHAIGTPIWVTSPTLTHGGTRAGAAGFNQLMIAQDVGSAIRGPERGDIFFGSGDAAGAKAGITKHPGSFIVLLPRAAAVSTALPQDQPAARPAETRPRDRSSEGP